LVVPPCTPSLASLERIYKQECHNGADYGRQSPSISRFRLIGPPYFCAA
jgi:hypothetical protein